MLLLVSVLLALWAPWAQGQVQPCDFPDIPHGSLHHEARYKPYFPVSVGKWYYYSCDNNYVPPSESSWDYLRCTRDGWSPKVPCLRKCVFNYLENGHSPRYEQKYLQGQSLKVNCYQGYSLENQQTTMTCTEDGWVPPPKCIRVDICLKSEANIENGFISESESTYTLHKEIKYNCRQGYITEDGQTSGYITCLQSGWSAQPKCVKSCDMPVFENARAKSDGTWFKVKDRLAYECQDGYKNGDGHTTGVIVCGEHGWSDTPTCHEKECIVPDIEANLLAHPQKDKYVVGDVLKFSCRHRLKLLGPDSVQCYHFGWSPNLPTCKAVVQPCGPPPPLPDGETTETPKGHYEHGEVVEYVCNPRFLMKGSRKVQCVDGEWTPPPVCIEETSTCGDIPALDHGSVSHATPPYHHGMSVEFSCGEAFTMIGHRSITCIRGNWTQPPQCIATGELAKCKLPTPTPSERIQLEWVDSEHNWQMSYSCGGKSGQKHSTCVNGRWEPEVSCREAPRCPPPPQIPKSQTMTTTVNYQEGEKISILCQENFLIQEGEEIVCRNGSWESIPRCVEKAPCPEPPHVEHGHVESPGAAEDGEETPGPQLYAHGTRLNYACNDGFRLSKEDGITCHLGKWGTSPQCVGLPCGPPPKIPNANMYNVLNSYQYGQKYTYSCLKGFGIQGPASVQCEGRKWSPEPECTKATCSQPPSFDNAIFVGPRKTLYRSGDRVTYRCQEYYQMDGFNYVTCKNNRWIGSLTCKDTSCGSPPAVENAFVQNNRPRYSSGDTVRYACKNSLDLFGNAEVSCLNGKWTDPPQCKGKCVFNHLENGHSPWYEQRYLQGQSLKVNCYQGYSLENQQTTMTCTEDGWVPPPKCIRVEVTCEPPRIANSQFTPDRTKYRVGHTIRYNCKSGYYPSSRGNTAKCTDIGWEPPPRCSSQPCDFPDIPHGSLRNEERYKPHFPVSVGKSYYYSCHSNYVTPSESSWDYLTCTGDGWSPEVPCLRKCVFNYLENGHSPRYERKYLQGQSLKVNCYQGYSLENQQTTMTCTEDGWVPPPKCIRVEATCSQPPSFDNAIFVGPTKTLYRSGDRVTYRCQEYYQMDGFNYVTCKNNRWIGSLTCKDTSCGSPPAVENAFVQNNRPRYSSGDTVRYACKNSLDLFGNAEVSCLNGTWTDPPQCKESRWKCGPPPTIDNGDITTYPLARYAPGSSVEYQCQSYYELQGNRKIECRDGKWSEPPKCLEPCVISEETMEKHHIRLRWTHTKKIYSRTDDYIEFICEYGYRKVSPQSAFRALCLEGKVAYPTCA